MRSKRSPEARAREPSRSVASELRRHHLFPRGFREQVASVERGHPSIKVAGIAIEATVSFREGNRVIARAKGGERVAC